MLRLFTVKYMSKIPPLLLENYKNCILGQLKLSVLSMISGEEDVVPSEDHMMRFLLNKIKKSFTTGNMFSSLMKVREYSEAQFEELRTDLDAAALLEKIRDFPLDRVDFLQISDCPQSFPGTIGALVTRQASSEGGYIYSVVLLHPDKFPEFILGYIYVETGDDNSKVLFGNINSEGKWNGSTLEDYVNFSQVLLALSILHRLTEQHTPLLNLDDLENIEKPEDIQQEDNEFLVNLISKALKGNSPLTRMRVPLSLVRPHDIDFCLAYPLSRVKPYIDRAKRDELTNMLVYWDGQYFVMDDDYPLYLAHRSVSSKEVSVTLLGVPPEGVGKIIKVGGSELIPPVGVVAHFPYRLPVDKDKLLEYRLEGLVPKENGTLDMTSQLLGLYLGLARLIQNPKTKERELHRFLLKHPMALDAYGFGIMSEVWLDKEHRIDLILRYGFNDKYLTLIELERATWPIFTKSGDIRSEVNHAVRQVEDWMNWWTDKNNRVPKELDGSLPTEGLVVVGRSINLSDRNKKRLLNINNNRKVKIITYDDLLDRLQNFMNNVNSKNS